ncbi:MAG: hypothetical protein HeimC3_38540 [Candidatus Heimdallarchaeota archaeon LC_3]|nr:MAG: hypothetical protein HeimC3_38540 [Candidatus Heimdallarchaeota archaeon LC_3]
MLELALRFYPTFSSENYISRDFRSTLIPIANLSIGTSQVIETTFIPPYEEGEDIWLALNIVFNKYIDVIPLKQEYSSFHSGTSPKLFGPLEIIEQTPNNPNGFSLEIIFYLGNILFYSSIGLVIGILLALIIKRRI